MAAAVARHYAVLDEAIASQGGVRPVEQGEGDSVVGAFARAADALRAAVEAQRSLTAELPWLRVRMAVHTGEAQLRDEGNYVGRTIIRCARLRACAHGGQIVVSEATAALLADSSRGGTARRPGNGSAARPVAARAGVAGGRRRVVGVVPALAFAGCRAAQPAGAAHVVHRA